jgi:hypothetical protein
MLEAENTNKPKPAGAIPRNLTETKKEGENMVKPDSKLETKEEIQNRMNSIINQIENCDQCSNIMGKLKKLWSRYESLKIKFNSI